jgi:hypothetical protein
MEYREGADGAHRHFGRLVNRGRIGKVFARVTPGPWMQFWQVRRVRRIVAPCALICACAAGIGGTSQRRLSSQNQLSGASSMRSRGSDFTNCDARNTFPQAADGVNRVAQAEACATETGVRGVEIIEHGGYPELHVDGAPFFIHSAAFFYYRIPADQWERLLRIYRAVGINTIDLYIPWNWHELKEGEIDFDGHTNPRRNLRSLLAMIARLNFKLIARPGPEILNEWRHGGYPGWLLDRPEYGMNPVDWIEGRYPPLDGLNTTDAEAAARGWLANSTHMSKSCEWLTAVSKELARYSSHRIEHSDGDAASSGSRDLSGPLLFVQLGDDFAIGRANRVGPDFWRYVEMLRDAVEAGGVNVPMFINPTDMRVSAAGSALERAIGVMGQWYMPRRGGADVAEQRFTSEDAGEIEFFTEELKTQPAFPPVMIEYQAGWYTPGEDDRPVESAPENTLLSSRLLIANGIHGFNYFPLQDTYTPAEYSVPWANRSYRWDAALAPDGEPRPRLRPVLRNMQILQRWGPTLAASHKRADFGIVYPLGAYPQELLERADIATVAVAVMRIERLGTLAMYSSELLDPQYQPVEELLRNPLMMLPVFDAEKPQFQLSEKAQQAIVEYVRRGGTLAVFPERPRGAIIGELWKEAASEGAAEGTNSAILGRWKFGEGEVIQSSKDFYSWIEVKHSLPEIRGEREAGWATSVLRELLDAAHVRPSVKVSGAPEQGSDLVVSEIISNEGSEDLGARSGGRGFLSVTNLSTSVTADRLFEALSPAASARGVDADYVPVHAIVPPHESLLLPLDEPICFSDPANAPCGESVATSGAEFLDAKRDGKTLELLFYAPSRAEIHFRLPEPPSHIALDGNKWDGDWNAANHELRVAILKGAAPRFIRVVSFDLPSKPHVNEAEKPVKPALEDIDYFVANSVRLPVGGDSAMRAFPPLIAPDKKGAFAVVMQAENETGVAGMVLDVAVTGALRGGGTVHLIPRGAAVDKIALKPSQSELMALPPSADGLLHSVIEMKMGHDKAIFPVAYLQPRADGVYHYRYDFDRDGADEWILENSNLRLIVSPESGGRALALVDKSSGANLSTSVGMFRDNFSFTESSEGGNALRARGRYGLFNRSYIAEWAESETKEPILRLHYDAPDIFPGGARIEKSIQLEDASGVRVDYRVTLNAPGSERKSATGRQQSFVAVNSFPAMSRAGRVTKFCWGTASSTAEASAAAEGPHGEGKHCEDFVRGGRAIEVPAGTKRVEVSTTGRGGIALEWECAGECGRMTIELKNFSALFRLVFPPLEGGGGSAAYTVHVRALGAE